MPSGAKSRLTMGRERDPVLLTEHVQLNTRRPGFEKTEQSLKQWTSNLLCHVHRPYN